MPVTSELNQNDPLAGRLDSVPSIDAMLLLSREREARGQAVELLQAASIDTGFFYVRNAFSDSNEDGRVLAQMRELFALADDDRRKLAVRTERSTQELGFSPMFAESAYQPGTIAHLESFDCGRPDRSPYSDFVADNLWPELPGFRVDVTAYWNRVTDIGNAALEVLALAVGLDEQRFAGRCRSQDLNTLRLLHYPENDATGDSRNVGISAHTDFECLTLLYQTAPGLELLDVNGDWYDVPAADGGLVVLLDDMLEMWTNGRLRATGHRVRHTHRERFSIVMFVAVDNGIVVRPLPEFEDVSASGKYEPTTQQAHIDAEMAQARANSPK